LRQQGVEQIFKGPSISMEIIKLVCGNRDLYAVLVSGEHNGEFTVRNM
jgi:hypothetical protein